ncbi:OmpA family protein [Brevundimonas sp.]|uniref:OmpA family protein n=1 Tax=Brevundimonas sp. TaxID=1871086 RepID=UPI00289EC9B3|nr:OmpA family protein [Brevundimonas sp.]
MKPILPAVAASGLILALLTGCSTPGAYKKRSDLVSDPAACAARRFEVYFDQDQARLTTAAREAISLTATQLQGCDVTRVQVLGLADARSGTAAVNQSLSERRARSVAEALAAAGLPAPAFEVAAAGAEGAVINGVNDPLRRRTEVVIEAQPRR